mmetsp:Transcript_14354/g.39525  ORF Transcript_14354/g.39525 Transcript_14354/m.39525 type:complete len:287 (-) Transcript_14354:1580-2440(-)
MTTAMTMTRSTIAPLLLVLTMMAQTAPVDAFSPIQAFSTKTAAAATASTAASLPTFDSLTQSIGTDSTFLVALSAPSFQGLLSAYTTVLQQHTLPTQIVTGATLAVVGDAIAQRTSASKVYDSRRAASFAVFDMAYRVLQHYAFPWIIHNCHGQFLGPALHDPFLASTLEQTLANQLVIVPFLYYPAFFALTGFLQGLTPDGTVQRARETFFFLMQRNLMFWIPVQFIQFGYVAEEYQIPFVCVAGLIWTCILSILAGSTQGYSKDDPEGGVDDEVMASAAVETSN